jgi:hypothetical protein
LKQREAGESQAKDEAKKPDHTFFELSPVHFFYWCLPH